MFEIHPYYKYSKKKYYLILLLECLKIVATIKSFDVYNQLCWMTIIVENLFSNLVNP